MSNLIYLVIAFAGIIAIALFISRRTKTEKSNLADTKKYCEENGYEFLRNMKFDQLPEVVQKFTMFQRHIGYKDLHSIVSGKEKDKSFTLQTFVYPGNRGAYGRLVCIINKKELNIPQFYMRDSRAITDAVGKLLGQQDINTTEDKAFSDNFLLQGSDAEQILSFFTAEKRKMLLKEHVKGYEYETEAGYFAISFPFAPSIPVAEYKALLTKTTSILKKLEA